jgi:hypothetical protein
MTDKQPQPRLQALRDWGADLLDAPGHIMALRMTALMMLLYGSSDVWLDIPLQAMCGALLLSPWLLRQWWAWGAVALLFWGWNISDWAWIDNHKYLMSYWVLACALALASPRPGELLAHNARWLIGLAFAFAVVWKLVAGQYLDGSFLHYTFLGDDRLAFAARWMGGVASDQLAHNRAMETELALNPHLGGIAQFFTTPQMRLVALVSSYWTLFIEALVAVAFLLPTAWKGIPGWFSRTRDLWLLVFLVTTYLLLPVLGFAYLLAVMGFSQVVQARGADSHVLTLNERRLRIGYLLLFAILQLARLPWEDLVWRWAGVG